MEAASLLCPLLLTLQPAEEESWCPQLCPIPPRVLRTTAAPGLPRLSAVWPWPFRSRDRLSLWRGGPAE